MLAEEMGSSTNRGKVIWVLASSRPDLIEFDLKRPGHDQNPIAPDVMAFQIELAAKEATNLDFVPPVFRAQRIQS
jgi:hypothetical protein